MARYDTTVTVTSQNPQSAGICLLTVRAPEIAEAAGPGQFCMLQPVQKEQIHDPLLRRPLSIHDTDPAAGRVSFLYRQVGTGTQLLSLLEKGARFRILGPLGNGFRISGGNRYVIVGGGMGIAPMLFLVRKIRKISGYEHDSGMTVILGAAGKDELPCLASFQGILNPQNLFVATEDGSTGHRGLVTELLEKLFRGKRNRDTTVLTCGPWPMMQAVWKICKNQKVQCQVSLEANMACGSGLCLGCAVPASHGGYIHVCREGPVTDAAKVKWDQ